MGSEKLIANLFRISQTEQKLKRDNIQGENNANTVHYKISDSIPKTTNEKRFLILKLINFSNSLFDDDYERVKEGYQGTYILEKK